MEPTASDTSGSSRWPGIRRRLRNLYLTEVLALIIDEGPTTARHLSAATGLSVVTTNNIVREFLAQGLIETALSRTSARGPMTRTYYVPPSALRVAVAVHRDDRLTASCADPSHVGPQAVEAATESPPTVEQLEDTITRAAREAGFPVKTIRHAVVGVPVGSGPQAIDWRHRTEIGLSGRIGCTARVRPHDELAALAEARSGAGRGREDFLLVYGDTDVSVSHVLDGVPRRGAHGLAGLLQPLSHHLLEASPPGTAKGYPRNGKAMVPALAAACLITDPALVVLTGNLARGENEHLPQQIRIVLNQIMALPPEVASSTVEGDPVMLGALQLAQSEARRDLLSDVS